MKDARNTTQRRRDSKFKQYFECELQMIYGSLKMNSFLPLRKIVENHAFWDKIILVFFANIKEDIIFYVKSTHSIFLTRSF